MATFWTSIGVMLIPVGLAILIQWPGQSILAFGTIIVGCILGVIGLSFTIRDEKRVAEKEREEREQRRKGELQRKREHVELLALIAELRSGRDMSTPRLINFIQRLEQQVFKEDGENNGL